MPTDDFNPDELLRDPRFPDRPTHADFWRLSELILQLDANSGELSSAVESIIDRDSLLYMVSNRAAFCERLEGASCYLKISAGYLEAFVLGYRFAQSKRASDPTTTPEYRAGRRDGYDEAQAEHGL